MTPKHIIVLRDGVTPSCPNESKRKEVEQVLDICGEAKLTYLLINKKTTVKIVLEENSGYRNIPPGTIVDNTILDTDKFQFFLVSQRSNQGLPQPTHYQVIYDNSNCRVEELHLFIYKMCFLYYNWTGAIKIPSPCQYAKKLAFLVGDKLSARGHITVPGERFNTQIRSLFFL
jgi:aubergine-like protein